MVISIVCLLVTLIIIYVLLHCLLSCIRLDFILGGFISVLSIIACIAFICKILLDMMY